MRSSLTVVILGPSDCTNEKSNLEAHVKTNPDNNPLVDSFGRHHSYLRIAITEKCNLRCVYCMPEEGVELSPPAKLLTADEIVKIASLFAQHGVDKIRLTGGNNGLFLNIDFLGEPTVRKDVIEIVERLSNIPGISQVAMTSNGIALSRKLEDFVKAGLNKLNISLDTLDEHKYQIITRRNGFKKVMQLIDMAEPMFNPLKINCVVMRGTNDNEICDFVALTEKKVSQT
uniref:Radical SAM core domain-containing protein n=1 Tax=Acrobeloides nanus TaxID=290746 RepID=A0A914E1E0_9BILA